MLHGPIGERLYVLPLVGKDSCREDPLPSFYEPATVGLADLRAHSRAMWQRFLVVQSPPDPAPSPGTSNNPTCTVSVSYVMFPQIGGHGKEQIIYALFWRCHHGQKSASTPRSSRGKRWNCWKTAAGPFMPFPENLGYRSGLSMIGSKRRGRRRQSLVPAAPKRPRFCDSAESWRW